jgi:hypothetical protein
MNFAAISIAANGWKLEDGTSANTTPCAGIAIRQNTVIAAWTDTDGVDLVAYFGISTKGLLVTDPLLIIPGGKKSASIQLTSGSVALIMPA